MWHLWQRVGVLLIRDNVAMLTSSFPSQPSSKVDGIIEYSLVHMSHVFPSTYFKSVNDVRLHLYCRKKLVTLSLLKRKP